MRREIGFFGTNGDAWPAPYGFVPTWGGTAGTVDINTNAARLIPTSSVMTASKIPLVGDFDIRFRWTPGQAWTSEIDTQVGIGDGVASALIDPSFCKNGFCVRQDSGANQFQLFEINSDVATQQINSSYTPSASTGQLVRWKRQGNVFKAKIWQDGNAEPADWTSTLTSVTQALNTPLYFFIGHAAVTNTFSVRIDQLQIDDLTPTTVLIEVLLLELNAVPVSLTDTGAGADLVTRIATNIGGETGAGADLVTLIATALGGDTGAGADSLSAGALVVLTDSGAGADLLTRIATTFAETAAGADLVTSVATALVGDTGAGADAVTRIGTALVGDIGQGADLVTQIRTTLVGDTGAGADNLSAGVHVVLTDTATGVDSIASIRVRLADLAATLDLLTQFHEPLDSTVRVGLVVVSFDAGHVELDSFDPGWARR